MVWDVALLPTQCLARCVRGAYTEFAVERSTIEADAAFLTWPAFTTTQVQRITRDVLHFSVALRPCSWVKDSSVR